VTEVLRDNYHSPWALSGCVKRTAARQLT